MVNCLLPRLWIFHLRPLLLVAWVGKPPSLVSLGLAAGYCSPRPTPRGMAFPSHFLLPMLWLLLSWLGSLLLSQLPLFLCLVAPGKFLPQWQLTRQVGTHGGGPRQVEFWICFSNQKRLCRLAISEHEREAGMVKWLVKRRHCGGRKMSAWGNRKWGARKQQQEGRR